MPNHVQNRITFSGEQSRIDTMLKAIQNEEYGIGTIDFNKLIPMPESLRIETGSRTAHGLKAYRDFIEVYTLGRSAEEAERALPDIPIDSENAFLRQRTDITAEEWALGKTAWQNMRRYGAPSWYDWSIMHWGTKWNAYGYDGYTDYGMCDELTFQTAWAAPHPILERLSAMFPDIPFTHQWADENLGANCGERRYLSGEVTDWYIPEGIRATEFALAVWDYDPLQLGLSKNSTGTAYIRINEVEYPLVEICGKSALFSEERITAEDIPAGTHRYDLRSGGGERFATIEANVTVDHSGTLITDEPLDLGAKGYIALTADTEPVFLDENVTMAEYLNCGSEWKQSMGGMQLL